MREIELIGISTDIVRSEEEDGIVLLEVVEEAETVGENVLPFCLYGAVVTWGWAG